MPRTASIVAKEDTLLLVLHKKHFEQYIIHDSNVKKPLQQVAHERIAESFRKYKVG